MTIYRHDYLICPWCGEESGCRVDHLYGDANWRRFGPWYCNECRGGFTGTVNAPGDVVLTKTSAPGQSFSPSLALLRLDGKDGPVFFVMKHDRYHGSDGPDTDEENQASQRYFFEEHSCPTNWLRECVCVIEGGDTDPHGFLSFVRALDIPADFQDHEADWAALFPEAFGAPVVDGTATEVRDARALENRTKSE